MSNLSHGLDKLDKRIVGKPETYTHISISNEEKSHLY